MKSIIRKVMTVTVCAVMIAFIAVFSACSCSGATEGDDTQGGATTVQTYVVTFVADGKTVDTVEIKGHENVKLPAAPEKKGYEFVGWYLDNGVWNEPFTAGYFLTADAADTTVYARYDAIAPQPQTYDITFYAFGKVVSTVSSAGNETIEIPTAPYEDGYEFVGWYLDDGVWQQPFTSDYFIGTATSGNVNVYARYNEIVPTITVYFDTDGGSYVSPNADGVVESAPYTEKADYDFVGWFTDAEKTTEAVFPFTPTENCTLYAKWQAKSMEFTIDDSGMITGVKYVAESGEVNIPETVNGVKVRGIASSAFSSHKDIVSVTAGDNVTQLGVSAFEYCTNLVSVRLSGNITELPKYVFNGCSSLTDLEIPSSVRTIGGSALRGTALTTITLPDSVKDISEYAFADNVSLTAVNLGKAENFAQCLFQNCTSLESVTFPDTVKSIDGNYMFKGCSRLTEVVYPDIDVPLQYNFVKGTAYYDDPANWDDGVLYVGNHAVCIGKGFEDNTSYSVRAGTLTIAAYAFYESSYSPENLVKLTLPSGLLAIGEGAFSGCTSLIDINIPTEVRRIYENAFTTATTDAEGYVDGWLVDYTLTGTTVSVRNGTVGIADGKITDSQSSVTAVILPGSLKYIGKENFRSMSALTALTLPDGLESIGESAFAFCSKLGSLYISDSVLEIGQYAFNNIPGLTLNIARSESDVPGGWVSGWNKTYASVPINFVWDYVPSL